MPDALKPARNLPGGEPAPAGPGAQPRAARELIEELYPICRSITGHGLRESLRVLQRVVPLQIHEIPTGQKVFDWTIPREWNIRDAWIKNLAGERVVDFRRSNLHVVNYSVPIRRRISLEELRPHLFARPDAPDWIPYRTSYYKENWGFCLTQRQLDAMTDAEYEVCIDSSLEPGSLSYGELVVEGTGPDEVLFSSHSCHPSLCNDNLSGMAVSALLARRLLDRGSLRNTYRFLWAPGTIGAIAWLATHEQVLPRIRHGLILSCVGDRGEFTYKRSRHGNAAIDRAVEHVLRVSATGGTARDYSPLGYDERQYGSPGIDLPVGCFMRTPNAEFLEYHTSADDLSLVDDAALEDSLARLLEVVDILEKDGRFRNESPKCEPQLGCRGLYSTVGGGQSRELDDAMLWALSFSDGKTTLLDIANRARMPFALIEKAARLLLEAGLLSRCQD